MALESDKSIMVGLATATVVYGIYQGALPNVADVRSLDAKNQDIASSEKLAAWTSAAVVGGISLISKDMTVFIIGAAMVIGMSWTHKHANSVDPLTKKMAAPQGNQVAPTTQAQAPGNYAAAPAPQYDATVM